jgi:hypothetical protein
VTQERIAEIEQKIADLKARWPAHSVPPLMWQELEELEDQLKAAEAAGREETHARQESAGQLQ